MMPEIAFFAVLNKRAWQSLQRIGSINFISLTLNPPRVRWRDGPYRPVLVVWVTAHGSGCLRIPAPALSGEFIRKGV